MKNIDVAFLPMNIPVERMMPAAAVECMKTLKPKVVYLYHYDQDWVTRAQPRRAAPGTDDARAAGDEGRAGRPPASKCASADWYPAK